jgi:hypothetical protein
MHMTTKQVDTFWVKIYMSGPIEVAKQIIRQETIKGGLCVTIEPTEFIYKGGEEKGFIVGFINYPRFPVSNEELINQAKGLADKLLEGTYQESYSLINPENTEWWSKRV